MRTIGRKFFRASLVVALFMAGATPLLAQAVTPSVPNNTQVAGRSFYVESFVVILLVAGAVVGVCRSSRRT